MPRPTASLIKVNPHNTNNQSSFQSEAAVTDYTNVPVNGGYLFEFCTNDCLTGKHPVPTLSLLKIRISTIFSLRRRHTHTHTPNHPHLPLCCHGDQHTQGHATGQIKNHSTAVAHFLSATSEVATIGWSQFSLSYFKALLHLFFGRNPVAQIQKNITEGQYFTVLQSPLSSTHGCWLLVWHWSRDKHERLHM